MEKELMIESIKRLKTEKTKFVNETFFWVDIARQCIKSVEDEKELVFSVPKVKNPEETIMKNGMKAVKGVCPDCGTKVFKILGKK